MFGKLAFFALGFALGTRSGRDGLKQAASFVVWVAERDEVQMAFGMARSAAAVALERGQDYASKRAA
jgi:hypothetical protein